MANVPDRSSGTYSATFSAVLQSGLTGSTDLAKGCLLLTVPPLSSTAAFSSPSHRSPSCKMHRALSYIAGLLMALLSFVFLGQVNALPVAEDSNKVLAKRTYTSSKNCPTNVN